jgi:hypothetical protein
VPPIPGHTYTHTQRSPLWILLLLVALALAGAGWLSAGTPLLQLALGAVAIVLVIVAFCFATLTVEDRGDVLRVRYGPIPLFRFHFRYRDISSVETARCDILDGLGIHYIPTRGWIYNLWGFDCVRITYRGRPTRIGTDDAEGLVAVLLEKTELSSR